MTLEEQVVHKLIEKNFHISFAESCTGGLCCAKIVNVANASSVLDMSFTTYADDAKVKLIHVNRDTISRFGVVSEQVAAEMAEGVAGVAESEVGVGVTGIAGPTGATANKPVGMVCFGFCINGRVETFTKKFGNLGRNNVRYEAVRFVLEKLNELL